MGEYLTYKGSSSFAHNERLPDENFARELMQLFSIGLVRLNSNGSTIVDEATGEPLATYSNENISKSRMCTASSSWFLSFLTLLASFASLVSFARIFTGFQDRSWRGNLDGNNRNLVDPMKINSKKHDVFPKTDLLGGYIGDRYPLCADLPAREFLRKGATYEFIGATEEPSIKLDATNSELYKVLCNSEGNDGPCRFDPTRVVESNLQCHGIECGIDVIDVVQVEMVTYQYVPRRCVSFQFFNEGQTVGLFGSGRSEVCLSPTEAGAGEICCDDDGRPQKFCAYEQERLIYSTLEERCTARGMAACSEVTNEVACSTSCCPSGPQNAWLNKNCALQIMLDLEGQIAVLHNVDRPLKGFYLEESLTWFYVNWLVDPSELPNAETNQCGACAVIGKNCLCDIDVSDEAVFQSLPSRNEALSQLRVGGFHPDVFSEGMFVQENSGEDDVSLYRTAEGPLFDKNTLFEVNDELGNMIFLRNIASSVQIQGSSAKFRNPPSFLHALDHHFNERRAMYEVEALLDHLVRHPNTAPFIAYRLIQQLVSSNPSGRYIEAVANAFRARKGDLAATVEAVLLDREAQSAALDADPSHGKLREPLIKLLHPLRSLEFRTTEPGLQIEFRKSFNDDIGQLIYSAPSVFSFFTSDFTPAGSRAGDMGLVAPEAEILTPLGSVQFMNGMISLAKSGLTSTERGFGRYRTIDAMMTPVPWQVAGKLDLLRINDVSADPEASLVLDRLDLLLTSGRLSDVQRSIVTAAYRAVLHSNGESMALGYALQLFFACPEFHISNTHKAIPPRTEPGDLKSIDVPIPPGLNQFPSKRPKAIVYLMLSGGADSFNMLVPHSGCTDVDLYAEYSKIRDSVALDKDDLLPIDVPPDPKQPCSKFGLHQYLKSMHQVYNDGDLLWIANAGNLVEPVDVETLRTKQTPNNNFAHNIMRRNTEIVSTVSMTFGGH